MRPTFFAVALAVLVVLSACDRSPETVSRKNPVPGGSLNSCAGSSAPTCRFLNSPVKLEQTPVRLPRRALVFYPTAEELQFVDAAKRDWVAPPKTLTDGASIPEMFISVIGDPRSREFANAAAIHDAYCGVGNEDAQRFHSKDWRSVHRMFYDALRVGGTPEGKAKVMYAAVYIGGPRWGQVRDSGPGNGAGVAAGAGEGMGRAAKSKTGANIGIPAPQMRRILRKTIGFIGATDPPLPEIEAFADGLLDASRDIAAIGAGGGDPASEAGTGEQEVGVDPVTGATDPATAVGPVGAAAGTGRAAQPML